MKPSLVLLPPYGLPDRASTFVSKVFSVPKPDPPITDEAYRAWIRRLPCLAGADGKCCAGIEAAHYASRGTRAGDPGNLFPACTFHHRQQHQIGIVTWQQLHHLNLEVECAHLWAQYLAERGERLPF